MRYFILCLFLLFSAQAQAQLQSHVRIFSPEGVQRAEIAVEVADTPELRAKGLMFRTELGAEAGMLFVFPDERLRSFWMKNTLLPLDIIFFNSSFSVVYIARGTQPYSLASIPSLFPAKYALEINAGQAEALNVKKGDMLKIYQNEANKP